MGLNPRPQRHEVRHGAVVDKHQSEEKASSRPSAGGLLCPKQLGRGRLQRCVWAYQKGHLCGEETLGSSARPEPHSSSWCKVPGRHRGVGSRQNYPEDGMTEAFNN